MYTGNDKGLRDELDYFHNKYEELYRKYQEVVVVLNQHTLLHNEKKDNVVVESNDKQKMYNPNDLLVGTVLSLYHVKDYEYKDNNWAQFLISVAINGKEEKFYRDTLIKTPLKLKEGDVISFRVHGTKIKEVNVIHEI